MQKEGEENAGVSEGKDEDKKRRIKRKKPKKASQAYQLRKRKTPK
jgi:hypothetical protein